MQRQSSIKINFISNAWYQLTNILVPLITLPYLSRALHAEGLGAYSFAYSVAYYFYMFIKLGLQNYGNRTIAYVRDDKATLSRILFEIYFTQFILGLVMSIIYLLYCVTFAPNKLLAFIFVLHVIAGGIDLTWVMYGLEEFKVTSLRDIITKIMTTILIFSFVKDEEDVWKYALIYCMGFCVNQLIVIPVVSKHIHFVLPSSKGVLSHIIPNLILFLPTIAVSVYKSMDKIMIGVLSTEAELGYYHSCENIIRVPLALITALGTVMLPRMSNMISKGNDNSGVEALFNKSIMFAMFISSSICMGMMTVSKEFVPLYYGKGFEKCIYLFHIILPSCLFLAFANVIRTQYLLPRKKDKQYIISLFTGAGVNLVLNLLLIPRLASIGAAIGTLAAEMVVCVVQAAFVFKEANIGKNIIDSFPFVAAGVVMLLLCRNYTPSIENDILMLVVKIVISAITYLCSLGIILTAKRTLIRKSV